MTPQKLLDAIVDLRNNLNKLASDPANLDKADAIFEKERKLWELHLQILKKTIVERTPKFQETLEKLKAVNNELKQGLKKLEDVVAFLNKAATVIDSLAELVAKATDVVS